MQWHGCIIAVHSSVVGVIMLGRAGARISADARMRKYACESSMNISCFMNVYLNWGSVDCTCTREDESG